MKIIRQVTFEGSTRRKDGSVKLSFTTDLEQTTPQFMEFDEARNTHGILYYSDRAELTQAEVDELDSVDIELEGKSKAQRLRAVLFILWKQQGEIGDFKEFYSQWMEKIIQGMKDKLEPEV